MSQLLFFSGGGGGGGGGPVPFYPWKIWVLVTLIYRKVVLNCFYNLNQHCKGPQTTMLLTKDLQEIIAIYLRWPSSWRYLDLLHRTDESHAQRTKQLSLLKSVLVVLVSCKVTFSRSISLAILL